MVYNRLVNEREGVMKKRGYYLRRIFLIIAVFVLIVSLIIDYLKSVEKRYYFDKNNYITEDAVVENIIYEEDYLLFVLSGINEAYQGSVFIIEGESLDVLLERGILEKIETGSEITYTSATRYFGNGYYMPMVALSVDGEELLSFDEGYKNLLKQY